jgi:uncharacterized BrkB/YihY/UPF0761 family membrane protein
MKRNLSDRGWISITLAFLGLIFIYDGLLDFERKKLSVIVGVIFMGISILVFKFPKKKELKN